MTPAQEKELNAINRAVAKLAERTERFFASTQTSTAQRAIKQEIRYTAEDRRDAEYLLDLVTTNMPFVKRPKSLGPWAEEIRKLREIDGYDHRIIVAVIEWCQNNPFWRKNIRSASKLREKFETLIAHAQAESNARKGNSLI